MQPSSSDRFYYFRDAFISAPTSQMLGTIWTNGEISRHRFGRWRTCPAAVAELNGEPNTFRDFCCTWLCVPGLYSLIYRAALLRIRPKFICQPAEGRLHKRVYQEDDTSFVRLHTFWSVTNGVFGFVFFVGVGGWVVGGGISMEYQLR